MLAVVANPDIAKPLGAMQVSVALQRTLRALVAPVSEAVKFSVESTWDGHTVPFAVFGAWKFLPAAQLSALEAVCPELSPLRLQQR